MRTFYDQDVDPEILRRRRVAILGYGAQGRAHALNLRDSGIDVRVALREDSASRVACTDANLAVTTPEQAAEECDVVMLLVPDEIQPHTFPLSVQDRQGAENVIDSLLRNQPPDEHEPRRVIHRLGRESK